MLILWEVNLGELKMKNENIYYVYVWIRKDINKIFYVGKGKKNRYKDLSSRNQWFLNIVNKIGMNNIEIKIIENNLTEDEAFEKEIYYISKFKEENHPLCNLTKGGEGSSDWYTYLSEEEKEHHKEISKSFLGKHHTKETIEKMKKSATGRKWDDEHKKLFSELAKKRDYTKYKGKQISKEHKEKLRKLRTNNPTYGKVVYKLDLNLNIQQEFFSRSECMRLENSNICTQSHIRTSIEKNKITNIENLYISHNNYIYIYKEFYTKLKPQSTIESNN